MTKAETRRVQKMMAAKIREKRRCTDMPALLGGVVGLPVSSKHAGF
jgi:hypothetical protein